MKREISVFDYAGEILNGVKGGVLLTTKAGGKVNSMTIGWGTLGIEWRKPVFIAFVRENRFTRQLLDESGEFTVNIPYGSYDKEILGFCGTRSGRDMDKLQALGLTLEPPLRIGVPGIRELPLTLECRVVYRQMQDPERITPENREACYPQDVDSAFHGANRDYHVAHYGEIVGAYLIEDPEGGERP